MSDFLDRLGSPESPTHIFLQHEESALVQELRAQIAALTAQNEELQRQVNHAQFRYGCEVTLCNELVDLCRQYQFRYGCEVTLCNELVDLCRQYKVPYRKSIDRLHADATRKKF